MTELFNITSPELRATLPDDYIAILAYRGSIAHGMYFPGTEPKSIDDVDLMGVVIGRLETYFGFHEWGSRGTKETKQNQYDLVFYEIRKMCSLLLQGNPNVLSLLWLRPEDYLIRTDIGRELIQARDLFVGKHVYNAFAGYAYAQLEKMETRDPAELREYLAVTMELKYRGAHPNHKGEHFPMPDQTSATGEERDVIAWTTEKLLTRLRSYQKKGENIGYMGEKRKQLVLEHGYDSKNAAHLIRLLRMCIEFLNTGELQVYRKDAEELCDIKRGKWALADVKKHAQDLFREAKAARDASALPDGPRHREVEAIVVSLLWRHFGAAR